jgi:hypothetical protein
LDYTATLQGAWSLNSTKSTSISTSKTKWRQNQETTNVTMALRKTSDFHLKQGKEHGGNSSSYLKIDHSENSVRGKEYSI